MQGIRKNRIYRFVEKYFEIKNFCKGELIITCPNSKKHSGGIDVHPSFNINVHTGKCYCHGCNLSFKNFNEFKKYINKEEETALSINDLKDVESEVTKKLDVVNLPDEYIPCYYNGVWKIPEYLHERKIRKRTIKKFKIGFCVKGYYKDRIIMPIKCGELFAFTSRIMDDEYRGEDKYKHAYRSRIKDMFLNYDNIEHDEINLVEGPFDLFRLFQFGFDNTLCSFKGRNKLSSYALNLLLMKNVKKINILYDADAVEIAEKLSIQLKAFFKIRVLILDSGDPDVATKNSIKKMLL